MASRSRRSYTVYFKLQVISYAEENGNHAAAKKFDVHRHRVQEWRQMKENINVVKKSSKRLKGGGRKAPFQDMRRNC